MTRHDVIDMMCIMQVSKEIYLENFRVRKKVMVSNPTIMSTASACQPFTDVRRMRVDVSAGCQVAGRVVGTFPSEAAKPPMPESEMAIAHVF